MEGNLHPHPNLPPSRGKGVFSVPLTPCLLRGKSLTLSPGERGLLLCSLVVGEAVSDEVLCCFHAVADFDAGGFAAHGFREEACDVFTVFGECW